MILSPAYTKWRGAYYACHICRHNADYISLRDLIPMCADCKASYVGIFGCEAFEIMREKREQREKVETKWQYQEDGVAKYKGLHFSFSNKTMSTIKYDRRCTKCGREPVAIGIPVFRNLAVEWQVGVDTVIWCIDCVRWLLHQEGEDEVITGFVREICRMIIMSNYC